MTRVVYRNNAGHHFECTGHADYDENGKDLVCAAVSILCCTLANALLQKGIEPIAYEDGMVVVRTDSNDSEVDTIFRTILTGFDQLSVQYPTHVKIF